MSDGGGGSEEQERIARWTALYERGCDFMDRGKHAEALAALEETLSIGRQIREASPDDPRSLQAIASPLYAMGSMLSALNRPGAAIRALAECEQIYLALGRTGQGTDIPAKLADVRARRGLANHQRGYGASAVLDLDDAVSRYAQIGASDPARPRLDLARVLSSNAVVLSYYGDPDLAVASADRAIRLYVNGNTQLDLVSTQSLQNAAGVAAQLHGELGRADIALEADQYCIRTAEAFLAYGSLDAGGDLVRALLRQSVHLEAAGRPADAEASRARARELDAAAFAVAETERQQRLRDVASGAVVTLRRALETPGNQPVGSESKGYLADPGDPSAAPSLSERYVPQVSVVFAVDFAERCLGLLAAHPNEALRLGLEAHYVFAIESRRQTLQMRYQLAEFGPHWARVLLACTFVYAQAGGRAMAEDLAGWLRGVAGGLAPFALIKPEIAELVKECSAFAEQYPATDRA
jgi:tetratricopeptide (TPR) repeat protein